MSQTIVTIDVGGTGANTAAGALISLGAAPAISFDQSNTAVVTANIANTQATVANTQANFARAQANAAFDAANTRVLRAGDTMTGNLNVAAVLITQNVIPDANITYDLGSSTARYKDLWLSNSTIHLGEATISAQEGAVSFGNATVQLSNVTSKLNVTNDLFVSGNTGLGITDPVNRLHVSGGIRVANTDARITFVPSNGGANNLFCIDNSGGLLRIFREDYSAIGNGANGAVRMAVTDDGNIGIGTTSPVAALHIGSTTSTRSLSLASPASGGGGGSYIIMGNNDSGGTAGPNLIVAANRALSFGVGDSFSSATGGTMTTQMHIVGATGNIGIGTTNPEVKLHLTQNIPSGIGSLPSGTGVIIENTGNNYITFRHSADIGAYSGIAFMDNNIGGYVIHGDGSTGDKLYLAGYGGVEIQQGTSSSVTPGARTTIGNFTSTGLTVTGTITETSSIRIKENINPITDALEKVLSMNGYTYDRIDGTAKQRAGLIAEEINEIIPNVVQKDAEGLPYGIQYTNIIAYLVEAIKELKTEINDLKKGV